MGIGIMVWDLGLRLGSGIGDFGIEIWDWGVGLGIGDYDWALVLGIRIGE